MIKKNNNILKVTLVVLAIASAAVGIVYSYGRLNGNVADNTIAIKDQKDENRFMSDMNIRQDKDLVEIKSDMRHMKEDVTEIKGDVKTILTEIRK